MNVNSKKELAFTGNWVIDAIKLGKERVHKELGNSEDPSLVFIAVYEAIPKDEEIKNKLFLFLKKEAEKSAKSKKKETNKAFQLQDPPLSIRIIKKIIRLVINEEIDNVDLTHLEKNLILFKYSKEFNEEIYRFEKEKFENNSGLLDLSDKAIEKYLPDWLPYNRLNKDPRKKELFYTLLSNNKVHLKLEIAITPEEKKLISDLIKLTKDDFEDKLEISKSLSSLLTNVNVSTDLHLDINTKGLSLFKSKTAEKYFFFVEEKESTFDLINEKDLKFFKLGLVKLKDKFYFIYHHQFEICYYANEILRRLIKKTEDEKSIKDQNNQTTYDKDLLSKARIFKHALIQTLVKYIQRASLKDFSIYEYSDENQRVEHLFYISFDSLLLVFLRKHRKAISKEVVIAIDKNNIIIKDFLPFALMKLSPTRLLLNQLLFEKTNKDPYLIYLLYKFYSLKNQNINEGVSESHYEINKYMYFSEIRNPFSYDNQVKEDKESLSYENFEEFKTIINDDKDREYVLSAVVKNNKAAFLNFVIKKIITDRNLLNDKIIKNMFKEDDTWMYLGAFVVIG